VGKLNGEVQKKYILPQTVSWTQSPPCLETHTAQPTCNAHVALGYAQQHIN